MKSLAIVPARGGSKRLPYKNIRPINEKPLVEYTIEAVIKSQCFQKLIFSSEDENILSIGKKYSAMIDIDIEKREPHLATDTSTVLELVCEISSRPILSKQFDVIVLLLPTCPFREAKDIQEGFRLLSKKVDGVVSLTNFEFPPQLSLNINEKGLIDPVFSPSPLITGQTRSQDQKTIYRPNGGFYMQWWKSFEKNQNFFKGTVMGYVMPRFSSVDIDDEIDLKYAQFLIDNNIINC